MDVDVAIIGAGIVGLACAAELARGGRSVVVLERHAGPVRETSSRNSGVVHAGLYYEPGSLMAETCVEGRELLYARCERDGVAHRRVGKLVVATTSEELAILEELLARGLDNGAGELTIVEDLARHEPTIRAIAALHSPRSGIVDVHELARSYAAEARAHGADITYRTTVLGFAPRASGWTLETRSHGERFDLGAATVVNAAGLCADSIAELAGVNVEAAGWRLHPCKGSYFTLAARHRTGHLVYPVPAQAGLGVHVTIDLGGGLRAGPDAEYVETLDLDVDAKKAPRFARALQRFLPEVRAADLSPDFAGIRPKLHRPGEPRRDFVISSHPDTPAMVHLVGIESPGLTASEAIARRVRALLA